MFKEFSNDNLFLAITNLNVKNKFICLMLPAHFHDAAGDLFMIVENFLDFQNSGNALVTPCYAP